MSIGIKVRGRAIEVLHVEDNSGDASLLKQVLKKAGFPNRLYTVADGEEATLFLKKEKSYAQAPTPDVVLLDLKLPKKDGLTLLNEIRQKQEFDSMAVIVLTGSDSDSNMSWAKRLNANHYVMKPYELEGFKELVGLLKEVWLKTFRKKVSH